LFAVPAYAFTDVGSGHWAYSDIMTLKEKNITQGMGNGMFGMGLAVTRAQFVTFLSQLMNWNTSVVSGGAWYASHVNAAMNAGAISASEARDFRPNDPITREEMAIMLVRSLGYETLAQQLNTLASPFDDVTNNIGYITMAKDLGIIYGVTPTEFHPEANATREQAASMMVRMYNKLANTYTKNKPINMFYAIDSFDQSYLISAADSVCLGWCRVEWDNGVRINQSTDNSNDYYRPAKYEVVLDNIRGQGKRALLMVSVENKYVFSGGGDIALSAYLISNASLRSQMVNQIAAVAADYDGVAIDFENLKASSKDNFVLFLKELKNMMNPAANYMAVAVQPARASEYFNGYDFRAIGNVADLVILMAHDYNAKRLSYEEMSSGFTTTPLTPINDVYYGLSVITDRSMGVTDISKICFQLSFASAQWKLKGGVILNDTPYTPAYSAIYNRIADGAAVNYSEKYDNTYITFVNHDDGTDNIVWYEDERSVDAKLRLASLFGVKGLSVWRLGIIPDDVLDLFR
jgi:hypothetical protein